MRTNIDLAVERVCMNIRAVREFRNYTQRYMGSVIGLSQNGYGKIEANQSRLTLNNLYSIADALEIDLIDLIDLDLKKISVRADEQKVLIYISQRKPYAVNYFRKPSEIK